MSVCLLGYHAIAGEAMAAPLFKPFRALGYITDEVPFAVQRRGKETYVTVSVGKSWQIYNTAKLTLVLVGPQLKHDITALASKGDLTFAAHGTTITECKRLHKTGEYKGHQGSILQMMVLGDNLLALDDSNHMLAWKIGSYEEPEARLSFAAGFTARCFAHPDTYLNKLVVGSQQGKLQLWNFKAAAMVHEFAGWGSPVKCLSPSPALDVLGVGLADGRAILHNLRYDETVVTFHNASGLGTAVGSSRAGSEPSTSRSSAVTAISFRTGAGVPLMAAGGTAGVVTVWNLEERRLATIVKDAHDAPLVALHFFAGEPLLMSAGADNAIKQWLFDAADGSARLLKFRSGHAAPPGCVQHYGDGLRLLSAGADRAFRVFSTIQDQQSRELSQKHTGRRAKRLKLREADVKLPRVLAVDACQVRERDWCNVITAHDGDTSAYTWRLQHFTLGEATLAPPAAELGGTPAAPVTAVAISSCGNFGLVGSASGRVDRYNMQSGQHRGTYRRQQAAAGAAAVEAHDGAVVGLAADSSNRLLVSASLDGHLRIWRFKALTQQADVALGAPATHLAMHPGSALAAVALDSRQVVMYDVEAARLVRRFKGHGDRITALSISEDSRWLLSASMDGTVRCWDIPSAQCLQAMRLGAPVTALSLSPSMDLLATCHAELRGIYLWSNQMMFGDPSKLVHSDKVVDLSLPTISSELRDKQRKQQQGSSSSSDSGSESDSEGEEQQAGSKQQAAAAAEVARPYEGRDSSGAPAPLAPQLVTLSLLPRAQVENLVALDLIKARNKPIAPPKKPAAAPFFLPTKATLERNPVFDLEAVQDGEEATPAASRLLTGAGSSAAQSTFLRLLRDGSDSKDYSSFIGHLRELGPAAIDMELRGMQLLEGCTDEEVRDVAALLEALDQQLAGGTNFEFCQAVLQAALAVHGEAVMEQPLLKGAAARLKSRLRGDWQRLDELLQGVRCMVDFFGNLQM